MNTIVSPACDAASNASLAPWTALIRKQGVALGVLAAAQRCEALALVWSLLPQGVAQTERQVNEHLLSALAGAAAFLDTDHVELRRWLVDAGWLQRDGFGREYRAPIWDGLPPELQNVAAPLRGLDTAGWVEQERRLAVAEREARRAAWQARQTA